MEMSVTSFVSVEREDHRDEYKHRINRKARRASQRLEHAKAELAHLADPEKHAKPAPLHRLPPAPTISLWFTDCKVRGNKFTAERQRPDARGKLKSFEVQIPTSGLPILRDGGQFWLVSVPIHFATRYA